jgi:hypothetical protein
MQEQYKTFAMIMNNQKTMFQRCSTSLLLTTSNSNKQIVMNKHSWKVLWRSIWTLNCFNYSKTLDKEELWKKGNFVVCKYYHRLECLSVKDLHSLSWKKSTTSGRNIILILKIDIIKINRKKFFLKTILVYLDSIIYLLI